MKRLLLVAVLGFAGWKGCQHLEAPPAASAGQGRAHAVETGRAPVPSPAVREQATAPARQFRCDGRRYCSQMTSRAEAEYFVRHCPDTRMDGDRDGIPCENDSRF